ncbi:MAG TPA: SGNH/GDSL hydrolase family protein [Chitinophagales bacterium]|nr:SGNH/GDSL hydrolase family protein [Chitinophagales bacterium]
MKRFIPIPDSLYSKLFYLSSFIFLTSCEPKVDIPEPSAGTADFSSYVAIGGSYTAGFADGALSKQGQLASFPNLLAQQMQLAGGGDFNQPLLKGDKGTYPDYDKTKPDGYKLTLPRFILVKEPDCKGEIGILPERLDSIGDDEIDLNDPSQRIAEPGKVFHNVGIPAMKAFHALFPGYADLSFYLNNLPFSPYFWRFATDPQLTRVIDEAIAAQPTFFTLEVGMNDVLSYALDGGIGRVNDTREEDISSLDNFEASLNAILDTMKNLGATGVIANVPDITTFPYFTTIEYDALELDAAEADSMNALYPSLGYTFHEGEHNPFVVEEDGVVRTIKPTEFVLLGIDVDSLKCLYLGAYEPIGDEYILSEAEIANVKTFTEGYNQIIAKVAAERNLAVVDLAGFIERIYHETTIEGIDFSAEFGSGGFFSLDGLHPNDRGQALIANEFIKVINRKFGAKLPLLNITEYRGVLFP